jgi:quercetin dioxygenase-like cupin family protein
MRSCGLALALLAACAPAQRAPVEQPAPAAAQPGTQAGAEELPAAPPGQDDAGAEARAEAAAVAAIQEAVNQTRAIRHECWARAAADDYRLAGRMRLRVEFDQPSAPPAVTVLDDEVGDPVFTSCLVAAYEAYDWPDALAPRTAIDLPFALAAPQYQYTVRAGDVAPLPVPGPLKVRVLLHEGNTGNDDVAVVLAAMAPSPDARTARWEAPADGRTTRLFYVIEGEIEVAADRKGKGVRVAAGQAVAVASGAPHAVRFMPDAPVTMVQIAVPASAALWPVVEAQAQATAGAGGRRRGKARLPAVQARPQVFSIAGGQAEVGIFYDRAGGHEAASLAVITAQPGMRIPAHVHERETEMVLILEGTGTMTIDGEVHPFEPMTAVQIPPGVEHAVAFEGDVPVRALQVYTPSGPEQRFKQPPP